MMNWIIIIALLIMASYALSMLKNIQAKRAEEVLDKYKDKKILRVSSNANYFGQESKGVTQIRGNGVLLLTQEELCFEMWAPKRELRIPVSSISGVESTQSHLSKSILTPLLKVVFKNESGQTDSAAWLVNNLDNWKESIEKLIQRG
ncbi:hypothetical protein ACFL2Y_04575 [Candidatus Omnitrophota bacterium]